MLQHPAPKPPSRLRRIVSALRGEPYAPQVQPATRMPDLETWRMPHRAVDVKDWEVALNMANNVLRPDRTRLLDLYDSILVDGHTASVMESRVLRVVRSKYRLVGVDGKPRPELTRLLETQWFEDFLQYVAEAVFRGHTLIELSELVKPGELKRITRVDPRNVLPWSGMVVRRRGEETGYRYREEPLDSYLIEVGQPFDLGLLSQVAPVVITKKYAVGSWSDYVEKFGIPPRWVTTPSTDRKRLDQLQTMMQQMVSSAYAIIQGTEKIEVMQTPGVDAHKVFDELISRMNSEISKRVLGQDGTSDNKDASGTYGSLKVLQGVAEDRHQADKASVLYVINQELFPRLVKLGYPLAGIRFEWDELRDLSPMELVDAAQKLGSVFEIDPEYMRERTGMKIIGIKRAPGEISDNGQPNPDNPDDPNNPSDPTKPSPPGPAGIPIQETALNGAQVASLLEIITAVANGELPVETARPLIRVAFPAVSDERISEMLNGMKGFTPPPPPDPTPATDQKSGRQSGKKKGDAGNGDKTDPDEEEDGDGPAASWPSEHVAFCTQCGGHRGDVTAEAPIIGAEAIEQLLRDVHAGAEWSQPYFEATAQPYIDGMLSSWRHDLAQLTYDRPDHVARATMEANIFRFSGAKTLALALDLNAELRESTGFADFKRRVEEGGKLERYNRAYLETEYVNAVNTGIQASRWYQMQGSADALPNGEYWTQQDPQVRPEHQALHRRIWPLSHPIWQTIWPPNGWKCRCTVLPTQDGPAEGNLEKQTAETLGGLEASGEMQRMKAGGFHRNRAITGQVFDLNKSYREQLGDHAGKEQKLNVRDSYGPDADRFSLEAIRKRQLPAAPAGAATAEEAMRLFRTNGKDQLVINDYTGRPWTLSKGAVEEHVNGRKYVGQERHRTLHLVPDVMQQPDEVWLGSRGGTTQRLTFIRYYEGQSVAVRAQVNMSEGAMRVETWYTLERSPEKDVRQGLLIKKMSPR